MKLVDLGVAVAAGLAVVFPLYKILTLPGMCESPNLSHGESVALMAAFASYLSVPWLFGLVRGGRAARLGWFWTPVLGSLLSAVALSLLALRPEARGLGQIALIWLALCVWTLPFAAAVHYPGMIIRRVRRWHGGPAENLSISRR